MTWYRLFLRDNSRRIVGRSDFHADNEESGRAIAARIAQDCSDICAGYDLLHNGRPVISSNDTSIILANLSERLQDIVIRTEIALRDSAWTIKESRRLLAAIKEG